jgi:DNA-binding response OmpR family regulator
MSGPNVVIVEDDPDIADIVRKHLERTLRAEVKTFAEGSKALRYLADAPVPALVVLDLSLPDISGFEVCHTLRESERTRDVPVLVLSARDSLDDKARADEVGVDRYVVKPIRTKAFITAVEELIESGRIA